VPEHKQRPGGPDDASPPSSRRDSALEWVRSLERASRALEKAITETQRSNQQSSPGRKADSGVRRRKRGALVVTDDGKTRELLVDRLIAEDFLVESASSAEEAKAKAARFAPDIVVIEHSANDRSSGEVVGAMDPGDAEQPTSPLVVVTIGRSPGIPLVGRCVTVVQRRDSDLEISDVVRAVMHATGIRR
jgi:hypothetical protein